MEILLETATLTAILSNLAIVAKWREAKIKIEALTTCSTYGCLTRQGIDLNWQKRGNKALSVIFFDIDKMKEANTEWGYTEVNRKISAVLSQIRSDEIVLGRWFSGDEIVILCLPSEAERAAQRLQQTFISEGMSATFAIAPCTHNDLAANVKPASDAVQAAKEKGDRGSITIVLS